VIIDSVIEVFFPVFFVSNNMVVERFVPFESREVQVDTILELRF